MKNAIKQIVLQAENKSNKDVSVVVSGNGTEIVNKDLVSWFNERGITTLLCQEHLSKMALPSGQYQQW